MTTTLTDTRKVSAAQVKYINDLYAEGQRYENMIAASQNRAPVVATVTIPTTMSDAHTHIVTLKAIVAAKRSQVRNMPMAPVAAPAAKVEVTEGMWIIGTFGFHTAHQIFKVQRAVHGSGRLYAKKLDDNGSFIHAPGAIRDLALKGRKMTLKEAKEYGALYGTCVRCGRTLTDEGSIAAGIGPICAEKF